MRHIALSSFLLIGLTVTAPASGDTRVDTGINWTATERARILESVLPVTPDFGGGLGLPINSIILSRIQGPQIEVGFSHKAGPWELVLGAKWSDNGGLSGKGFDRDYFRLEDSRIGIRGLRNGPRTGDSVYASERGLKLGEAPFDQTGSVKEIEVEPRYFWGPSYLGLVFAYEDYEVDSYSPGYLFFNTRGGPSVQGFYAPLSFEIRDFDRRAGLSLGHEWYSGSWLLSLDFRIGYSDIHSRYYLYTRNRSVIWDAHGLFASLGIGIEYKLRGDTATVYSRFRVFRSSTEGVANYSEAGIATLALSGSRTTANDIARVETRRISAAIGARWRL